MAYITVVSGGAQPVFATDVLNGNPAQSGNLANAAVTNFQGPKLDFFTVTAASSGALTGTQVSLAIQATQQLATVYIYEFTTAGPDTLAMAVYPTAAWTTATLQTAIRSELTAGGVANAVVVSATATFTN